MIDSGPLLVLKPPTWLTQYPNIPRGAHRPIRSSQDLLHIDKEIIKDSTVTAAVGITSTKNMVPKFCFWWYPYKVGVQEFQQKDRRPRTIVIFFGFIWLLLSFWRLLILTIETCPQVDPELRLKIIHPNGASNARGKIPLHSGFHGKWRYLSIHPSIRPSIYPFFLCTHCCNRSGSAASLNSTRKLRNLVYPA